MNNVKLIKKLTMYFLPVVLAHIIFTLIDKSIQLKNNDVDLRLSIIHLSIYFYFFVVPIYLMILNVVYSVKKEMKDYYDNIKLGAISIVCANILVLIINIISSCFTRFSYVNILIEFFIILIPELIMFGMISFLGGYLVKKQDDDFEEETLEGLKIPEREVEFYKNNEICDGMKDESDEILEKEQDQYELTKNESKVKEGEEIYDKPIVLDINNWDQIEKSIQNNDINKIDKEDNDS
ncbi:hypothetical protein [Clostridium sp. SM-530-WT-3G]|uniref:hypothetical protein n=1 Tax=Clostridium sp. SM-530-WT-3G TaxID=2725303 RepID=UPI00145EB6B9|nr:hypothetical protein [Clostridium sp. SM-530-WT-3G]NME82376.1 hypothetical protein [Clostridium sp. SM-530-WT-3G]